MKSGHNIANVGRNRHGAGRAATTLRALRAAGFGVLLLYALFFAVLSVDVMLRVWSLRDGLPGRGGAALLLGVEVIRSVTIVMGVVLAAVCATTARRRPGAGAAAVLLASGLVAYALASAYTGYAGAFQEGLAITLRAAGVPQRVLSTFFGPGLWPLWPLSAALLGLGAAYPRVISADVVLAAGGRDRAGLLRDRGVGGADVGALFRQLTVGALRRGLLTARPLLLVGLVGALLQAVLRPPAAYIWVLGAVILAGMAIPLLRVGLAVEAPLDGLLLRRSLRGLRVTGALLLLVATAALLPGPAAAAISLVAGALVLLPLLLALIPAVRQLVGDRP